MTPKVETQNWVCLRCGDLFEGSPKPKKCPECSGRYIYRFADKNENASPDFLTHKDGLESAREVKSRVINLLLRNDKGEATEVMAEYIKQLSPFYTLKTDEKSEMWTYYEGIYLPCGFSVIQEITRWVLMEAYTKNFATKIAEKIQADTFIEPDVFFKEDKDTIHLIPVENGILNLNTRELLPFTPEKIFFSKLPVKYDSKAKCPNVLNHFKAVIAHEKDLGVVQELFGYLLYKENKFEKGFLFYGPRGRNGKSKTVDLMKTFLGVENVSSIPGDQFDRDPYAKGELLKKMLNVSPDMDKNAINNTGAFRELTGRDMITASRKFLNRVKFTPYAKMLYLCNDLAIPTGSNLAFWNRWIFLTFPYTFLDKREYDLKQQDDSLPEKEKKIYKLRDPDIIDKLTSEKELSGLLNWALDGLDRLLKNKEFSTSLTTDEIRLAWLRKTSSFTAFSLDWLEEEYNAKIRANDLKEAYSMYCQEFRVKPDLIKFKDTLHELFGVFSARESTTQTETREWYWQGIKFKDSINDYVSNVSDVLGYHTLVKKTEKGIEGEELRTSGTVETDSNNSPQLTEKSAYILVDGALFMGVCESCSEHKEMVASRKVLGGTKGVCEDCWEKIKPKDVKP